MILRVETSLLALCALAGLGNAQAPTERCGLLVQSAEHGVRIGGAASYVEAGRWLAAALPASAHVLVFMLYCATTHGVCDAPNSEKFPATYT